MSGVIFPLKISSAVILISSTRARKPKKCRVSRRDTFQKTKTMYT